MKHPKLLTSAITAGLLVGAMACSNVGDDEEYGIVRSTTWENPDGTRNVAGSPPAVSPPSTNPAKPSQMPKAITEWDSESRTGQSGGSYTLDVKGWQNGCARTVCNDMNNNSVTENCMTRYGTDSTCSASLSDGEGLVLDGNDSNVSDIYTPGH